MTPAFRASSWRESDAVVLSVGQHDITGIVVGDPDPFGRAVRAARLVAEADLRRKPCPELVLSGCAPLEQPAQPVGLPLREQLSLEEPVEQAAQRRWSGRVEPLVFRCQVHCALRSRDADLRNSQPFQIPVHGPGTSGEVDQPVAGDVVALRDGVGKQPAERERASLRRERIAHRAVGSAVKPFGSDRNGGRERNPFAYRAVEHGQRYGELEDAQHRQRPVVARDRGAVGCQHGDADRSFAVFQNSVDAALELLPGCFAGREHRCKEQQGDHSFHVGRVYRLCE